MIFLTKNWFFSRNILLAITENNKLQAKLADVGLSRKINPDDVLTAGVGSLDYKSPEIRTGNYDFKTDIWCLILLEI